MNRTIKTIDVKKWYHRETLLKHFQGWAKDDFQMRDLDNKVFNMLKFGYIPPFIQNPKNKRYKRFSEEARKELDFKWTD